MASSASFVLAFLLATTTAVAVSNAAVATNATATSLSRSTAALPAATAAHNGSGQYTCYLCHKSRSLMIRQCPMAQDDCHLSCVTLPTPAPPLPPRAVAAAATGGADRNADDCYLMKMYPDRSWVVVDVASCKASAPACYLSCGKGDQRSVDGVPPLPHGLPQFERCGPSPAE